MKTISDTWFLIDSFLLRGIFTSVFIIILAKLIFKNKLNTEISLNIIRITLIIHSLVYIILFTTSLMFKWDDLVWTRRVFGPHWWAYWIMMTMNSILPLTLLFKKLKNRKFYLLLVSILMNIGWIFESFVLHMTYIESEDYVLEGFNPYLPSFSETLLLTQGIIIGIILLIIVNLYKWIVALKQIK